MSQRSPFPDWPTALFAGSLVSALHTITFGYAYGGGDHDDLLPPILARLEPGLFAFDPYVQSQFDGFTVRTAFHTLMAWLGSLLPLHTVAGGLHLLVLVGVGAGVFALARSLRAGRTASVIASLLACVALPFATIGGNMIVYPLLTPEGIAWAMLLPGIVLFIQKHRKWAAVLLGLATWMHPLAGGLTLLVLTLVAALEGIQKKDTIRDAIGFPLLAGLVAMPLVLPALLGQAEEAGAALPDGLDPYTLYATLRFPHHYLPTGTPLIRFSLFVTLAIVGTRGYVLGRRTKRPPDIRFPLRFLAASSLLILVATVGIYVADSLTLARMQTYKLTVWLNVLGCVGVAVGAMSLFHRDWRKASDRWLRERYRGMFWLVLLGLLISVWQIWIPATRSANRVTAWIAANTPREAVFVVPPSMADFRVPAERSAVVTWKSVPFRTDLAADWWKRIAAVADLQEVPRSGEALAENLDAAFGRTDDDHLRDLAETYGASHAMVRASRETEFPVLFEGSSWKVLQLSE